MSLDHFIAKFPKGLVAFVFITLGIVFIILNDPPKTICDAEIELFKNEHRSFLAPNAKSTQGLSQFDLQKENCKRANGPGGCYELFTQIKKLLISIDGASMECRKEIAQIPLVSKALWQTARLFVHMAWGAKPPTNSYEKVGWFDYSDINLFCRMQDRLKELYGARAWHGLQEEMFTQLPEVKTMQRERAWNLMLLSVRCNQYQ
ncbi:MAG: hypothetical protein KDD58_12410 [Bdellovibrionales bacterium]|nr:hypothetical protein [Bdellovibrionales bacterium]